MRLDSVSFGLGLVCESFILSGGSTDSSYANESFSLFIAEGAVYVVHELGVRAIVEVNSNVTMEQINKVEDKQEETWNTEAGFAIDSGYYINDSVE